MRTMLKQHCHTTKLVIANVLHQPLTANTDPELTCRSVPDKQLSYISSLCLNTSLRPSYQFLLKQTRFLDLNQRDSHSLMERQWNKKNRCPKLGKINGNKCSKWVRIALKWLPELQDSWPGQSGTLTWVVVPEAVTSFKYHS